MNTTMKQPHEKEIFGHPAGLYVLFFVERFNVPGIKLKLSKKRVSDLTKKYFCFSVKL